jgi:hypothetical protein
MKQAPKQRWGYLLLGVACLAVSLAVGWTPYGQRVNRIFYDLYFRQRGPATPAEEIVIVAIDDATLAGAGPLPLDRARLAQASRAPRSTRSPLMYQEGRSRSRWSRWFRLRRWCSRRR